MVEKVFPLDVLQNEILFVKKYNENWSHLFTIGLGPCIAVLFNCKEYFGLAHHEGTPWTEEVLKVVNSYGIENLTIFYNPENLKSVQHFQVISSYFKQYEVKAVKLPNRTNSVGITLSEKQEILDTQKIREMNQENIGAKIRKMNYQYYSQENDDQKRSKRASFSGRTIPMITEVEQKKFIPKNKC